MSPWSIVSDTDVLTDVLVCEPTNYPWERLNPSVGGIQDRYGRRGATHVLAQAHGELVDALTDCGVRCHWLPPTEGCTFQVFTRDQAVVGPTGPALCRSPAGPRLAEREVLKSFFQKATRTSFAAEPSDPCMTGTLEGGDVHLLRLGVLVIGCNGTRTSHSGANEYAAWFRNDGWEVRVQEFDRRYAHLDMIFSMVTDDIAVLFREAVESDFERFLKGKGIRVIMSQRTEGKQLACNVLSLGYDRVLSSRHARDVNRRLRAEGLRVIDPDVEVFALDGGSVRCMTLPLNRLARSAGG